VPEVGIATLELLERFGHEVVYPRDQTCCGQPMANSGFNAECAATEALFVWNFSGFDYVVAPSGSCVHHVRANFDAVEQTAEVKEVRARTYEIVEFLHDIQKPDAFPWARFPHRVGLHNSCGTLRALKHAKPSELNEPFFSKPMDLARSSRSTRIPRSPVPKAGRSAQRSTVCAGMPHSASSTWLWRGRWIGSAAVSRISLLSCPSSTPCGLTYFCTSTASTPRQFLVSPEGQFRMSLDTVE
jgi:hypothetical protein